MNISQSLLKKKKKKHLKKTGDEPTYKKHREKQQETTISSHITCTNFQQRSLRYVLRPEYHP